MIAQAELNKLKWRCRRGLLENDLFIERFFKRHEETLTVSQAQGLQRLMALADPDLLDLLLSRREPDGDLDDPDVRHVLAQMREPPRAGLARPGPPWGRKKTWGGPAFS
jgi:antitoxin CptB